jgi:hypothetical protein
MEYNTVCFNSTKIGIKWDFTTLKKVRTFEDEKRAGRYVGFNRAYLFSFHEPKTDEFRCTALPKP